MGRRMTQEEVQDEFLDHLWGIVHYWDALESLPNDPPMTQRRRLEGLVHHILVTLDGVCDGMPAFEIYPNSHPDDEEHCKKEDRDWWPVLDDEITVHGGSMLHELWFGRHR